MRFGKPFLAAFALGSVIALPAHAELDVASLKQSIETSFESEYPKLDALYKNGDGPTILVRTELDALPMEEKTGLPYASRDKTIWQGRETFVTHSCGHDIHMASWVGTAKTLVGLKDRWHGTL